MFDRDMNQSNVYQERFKEWCVFDGGKGRRARAVSVLDRRFRMRVPFSELYIRQMGRMDD